MMLTRGEYMQNKVCSHMVISTSLQEFLRELVDNKKMVDLHILTSFVFHQFGITALKGGGKLFKWLVGEISKHNVRVRYGMCIEKLPVLSGLYMNCGFDMYDSRNNHFEDRQILRRNLIESSTNILRDDFVARLSTLSDVEINVLAFFMNFIRMKIECSYNMKPSRFFYILDGMTIQLDNGGDYYNFDDLKQQTIMFREIFGQELGNDEIIRIKSSNGDGNEGKIHYWKFGDIIVKSGIGYWVADNSLNNVLVVPKFLYDMAKECGNIPLDIKDFDVRVKRMENILKGENLDLIYDKENDFDNKGILSGCDNIEDKYEQFDTEDSIFRLDYSEKDIENYLCKNIARLEEGLRIIGNQYIAGRDRIDILCKDKNDIYVVVEIKIGNARDGSITQTLRYMSWIEEHLARCNIVRGIIVANSCSDTLDRTIRYTRHDIKIKIIDDILNL